MATNVIDNFELHIRVSRDDGSFLVTARVPAADQWVEGMLDLALDSTAIATFLDALEAGSANTAAVQDFGALLFNALFHGRIKDLYTATRARQGRSLRYRLILDSPVVARLPWELLYDPDRHVFLALEASLVRGFGLTEPTQALEVQPPLRILVSAAFPTNLPPISGQDEVDGILHELTSLVHRKDAEVVPLLHASPRSLQNILREAKAVGKPFHVLHVIGHGTMEPGNGHALLFFENEQGLAEPIQPDALADILRPFDLKLVYLNACESVALSAFDLTQGFAPALMAIGIPAVIGVQVAVWDRVARQVAQDFYAALADNQPVDQALLSARQLARSEPLCAANIAVPVCYLRTTSGQIVNLLRPEAPPLSRTTWQAWLKVQATPKKLIQAAVGLVGLVSALLGIYWGLIAFLPPPAPTPVPSMTGDYKIAVAAFQARNPDGNPVKSDKGMDLASGSAEQTDLELQSLRDAGIRINLYGPDLTGYVQGASASERAQYAEVLSKQLNADLLLYGDLIVQQDRTSLIPYVYISSQQLEHALELAGHHQFGEPIQVEDNLEGNIIAPTLLREKLARRTASLAKFVGGLGYFKFNDLLQAAHWFEDSQGTNDDFVIQRIVLLFLGSTAALQDDLTAAGAYYQRALNVDPNYARAELGRAQIQFLAAKDNCESGQVDDPGVAQAIQGYQRALAMDSQPFDEIRTKANLFLGHAHLCQSLATPADRSLDADNLRRQAESEFRYVVDRYRQTGDPGIQYLASAAWQSLGGLYASMSQDVNRDLVTQAEEAYRQAVALGQSPTELAISHLGLALVHTWRVECQAAHSELDQADAIYQQISAANPRLGAQQYETFRPHVAGQLVTACPP